MRRLMILTAVLLASSPAMAQQLVRETVPLVTANAPTGITTLYGGTYIVTQACTAYGTVTVRYRDPNGTLVALVSKTAVDTAGGTLVYLGAQTVVDATVSGTTGCNVLIARVPA